jgi:hypothetical protein
MLANHTHVIYALGMRSCAKLGCQQPPTATIGIRYRARELVVADLLPEQDPNLMDLCEAHTGRMKPPFGWTRVDARRIPAGTGAVTLEPGVSSA